MRYDNVIKDIEMRVVLMQHYSSSLFLMELEPTSGVPLPATMPGQFVQIHVKGSSGILLRRPLSIYYSDAQRLGLLIQRVGKGTQRLAEAQLGEVFSVLMPLGHGFSLPTGQKPLLVGGGVGLAPLFSLGQFLRSNNFTDIHFLFGARSATLFPEHF